MKQLHADLVLTNKILRDVIEKTIELEVKKEITTEIIQEYSVSIAWASWLMMIHRSCFYYIEKKEDYEVSVAIKDASEFGDGFWKIFVRIRWSGKN